MAQPQFVALARVEKYRGKAVKLEVQGGGGGPSGDRQEHWRLANHEEIKKKKRKEGVINTQRNGISH